jgi:hypothetical protein
MEEERASGDGRRCPEIDSVAAEERYAGGTVVPV